MEEVAKLKSEQRYKEAIRLLEDLESAGFEGRLAGGCVRDRYLGRTPKDYDIATTAHPGEVSLIFKQKSMKVVPTGIDHGTVTVVGKFGPYEITTLRKDINTDGRHAQVEFGTSFEEDAARRDFTMNAMFEDRQGQVYDYFLGKKHIDNKELHFVGDARQRIQEDYLRILRMYRFWARYACTPNEQTLQAVTEIGAGLIRISQERITAELLGLLEAAEPELPLAHLFTSQIIRMILPDAVEPPAKVWPKTQHVMQQWKGIARLAILLQGVPNPDQLQTIGQRLRLSNPHVSALMIMVQGLQEIAPESSQAELMTVVDRCEAIAENLFLNAVVPVWESILGEDAPLIKRLRLIEETKHHIRKAALPLSSKDIMVAFNIIPGPELGDCLKQLKDSYRNEEWRDKESGIAWLASMRNQEIHE